MRISTKVSLAFTLLALVVFGGLGTVQLVMEKRDLERSVLHETSTLAIATAESIRHDLAERAPDDSSALLRSVERFDGRIDVMVWRAGEQRESPHAPVVDDIGREAIASGELATRIELGKGRARVAVVATPIDSTREQAALVVVRPLDEIDADVWREARIVGVSVAVFSILGGLLGFALGEAYIGRPLAKLDRAMSSLGTGDFGTSVVVGRDDEVGSVLRRFEEMRIELAGARDRLRAEQDAHRATLKRLAGADRLVTVGQLAAGLAHEIGSPLQILQGRARRLKEHAGSNEKLQKGAETIATQAERITRIVRQLLQFARPRAHDSRRVDAVATVREVVDLLELDARRRGITIVFAPEPIDPIVSDGDALQQIVFNLARNGLAAAGPGGTIEIDLQAASDEDGARTLQLVVSDDGPGMTDEMKQRAFEPFFTTRLHEGGIGLGLAVVQSLVQALRGTVVLDSKIGAGTRFAVRIPC